MIKRPKYDQCNDKPLIIFFLDSKVTNHHNEKVSNCWSTVLHHHSIQRGITNVRKNVSPKARICHPKLVTTDRSHHFIEIRRQPTKCPILPHSPKYNFTFNENDWKGTPMYIVYFTPTFKNHPRRYVNQIENDVIRTHTRDCAIKFFNQSKKRLRRKMYLRREKCIFIVKISTFLFFFNW